MKQSHLIESRFRGVYAGLLAMWLAACLSLSLAIDSWLIPQVIQQRVSVVQGLIRSHHQTLLYNDNRALRDELLAQGVVSDDRNFDELWIENSSKSIRSLLKSCHFVTDSTCIGAEDALLFNTTARNGFTSASFAIHLRTDYFSRVRGALAWKLGGASVLILLLGFVGWAIRRQEKFLIQRIGFLLSTFSKVESLFQDAPTTATSDELLDEFQWLSQSMEQAGATLRARAKQIEDYRQTFAQRAQIEQLAITIGHTSHDLLAPMLEAKVFLQRLPDYLETLPRDRLFQSIESLEKRVSQGAEALRTALQATKNSYAPTEKVDLAGVLASFKRSVESNSSLRRAQIQVDSNDWSPWARVVGVSSEIDSVLWNLLKNSIDAKQDSTIQMKVWTQSNEAVLHYRDDGPGIPEAIRAQIFDDFFTTKASGTGFGLASARRLIVKSKGTIEALPSSRGALFEIRLPLTPPQGGEASHA